MAKQLPARRSSGAVQRVKMDLGKARSALASYRSKVRASVVPSALMGAGATIAGAAGCGAIKGMLDADEVAGVPVEAIGGLVLGTAGVALEQPLLIHAGAGFMAPYVAAFVEDWTSDMGGE